MQTKRSQVGRPEDASLILLKWRVSSRRRSPEHVRVTFRRRAGKDSSGQSSPGCAVPNRSWLHVVIVRKYSGW